MDNIAIKVEDVSKIYKLYTKPSDRLKESLGLTRKKCYTEHFALDRVNIEVMRGETVGIIGTNGSGKSTILKIITGVLNPSSGDVTINGRISALLELGAGFNMEYTGIENIYLNGTMIGFSNEEIDEKLQDILDFADIGDFVHQPVKTYSSGMFVRLAFAVAINIDPEILIVDEALSVGDVFFQAKCYRKFEEFKEQGKTILFVSHDLSSISKYCDRVVLLNKGKKLAEGAPKEIVDLYKKILTNADEVENPQPEKNEVESEDMAADDSIVWKSHFPVNPSILEYGKKEAEIIDFALIDDKGNYTNNLEKGKEFQLKMKILFHETINDPIFAFTIKDLKGTEITGTNTMFEHAWVGPQTKGNIREVCFRQRMTLQGGEYLLSLGCTGFQNAEFNVYHRLYDVCSITVISERNTVGFYDMESEVTVK